jgi:TetR/AcrR family transcriptional regulator, regulator of mycofactocin system
VTSRQELERVALGLFSRRGFQRTTVEDVAAGAGISRRTFFRYFDSKNDVVWGDFEDLLAQMEAWLSDVPDDVPVWGAVVDAVVRFNSFEPEVMPVHRQRMALILQVPALQAHSTLRYAGWRAVVARFVAARTGNSVDALQPQLVAHLALAAATAAYECWLGDEAADLGALLETSLGGFDLPHLA